MFHTLVEYILTSDSVLGDAADIVDSSTFGGKINEVLQAFFDNLTYLKNEVDNFSSGPSKANQTQGRSGTNDAAYMTSLRNLDQIRNGTGVTADTTRQGVSTRATQAQVNTGTAIAPHITPATFNNSDVIQSVFPAAAMAVTGHNPSDNVVSNAFTVSVNQVLGKTGFLRIRKDDTSQTTRIRITGGGWRLASLIIEKSTSIYTTAYTLNNVNHDNNYFQFLVSGGQFTQNDFVNLIVYVP